MGYFRTIVVPTQPSVTITQPSELDPFVGGIVGADRTKWEVYSSSESNWVAIVRANTLSGGEGHVVLMSHASSLISDASIRAIWRYISKSDATLSFDPKLGEIYERVTIIGDPDLDHGLNSEFEERLRKEGREVIRVQCRTAKELVKKLADLL